MTKAYLKKRRNRFFASAQLATDGDRLPIRLLDDNTEQSKQRWMIIDVIFAHRRVIPTDRESVLRQVVRPDAMSATVRAADGVSIIAPSSGG